MFRQPSRCFQLSALPTKIRALLSDALFRYTIPRPSLVCWLCAIPHSHHSNEQYSTDGRIQLERRGRGGREEIRHWTYS